MRLTQKFGRRILAAFIALAALALLIATVSVISLRSVVATKDSLVSGAVQDMLDADGLPHYHQALTAEVRGYLLSHEAIHLEGMEQAHAEFMRHLNSLLDPRPLNPQLHDLLLRTRSLESNYVSLLRQAFRNPKRANWMLRHQIKPARLALEGTLSQLERHYRVTLDTAIRESTRGATSALRSVIVVAAISLALLAALCALVYRMLRQEQRSLTEVQQSRDILASARQRASLLADAGKALSESDEPRQVLALVARRVALELADFFLIELGDRQGRLETCALAISAHPGGSLLESLHSSMRQGLSPLFGGEATLAGGHAVHVDAVTDERLKSLGVRSYLGVPLRARGHVLGLLLMVRCDSSPSYSEAEFEFAQDLGYQAALALDNARLLQEAQSGLRMREELLATVAHDLRNPLAVIRMHAQLGQKSSPEGESARRSYDSIFESALTMERLINDLLELTKIESGRVIVERSPHDAAELIDDCIRLMQGAAAAKKIELVREVREGECIADCDRSRVSQILSNIVANAIKFTPSGGRVSLEARATGEGIRFSVVDNGPGIPADQLPHIFDKYWQVRHARSRGTGLGLSIARGLVEAHGGRIWAESALNIGSRFFFTLPEARRGAQPRPRAA